MSTLSSLLTDRCDPSIACRGSQDTAIAVLHPRKLAVYTLQAVGGVGSAASYYELHKNYEHKLGVDGAHFTAYNMCFGSFGGAHGKFRAISLLYACSC